MKIVALFQSGALWIACLLLGLAPTRAAAQATPEAPAARTSTSDEAKQAELLKAYLDAREQLHTTQLAIANSRVEAATEKLEVLRKAMEIERDRQQAELQRVVAETERRHAETERSQRAVVWAAASFGVAGLFAMLMMPVLQGRALRRAIEPLTERQLALAPKPELLPVDTASDQTVSAATERLLSMIGRVERRINELEQTATPSAPAVNVAAVTPPAAAISPLVMTSAGSATTHGYVSPSEPPRRASADRAAADRAAWIAVLMNKGRTLITANKAQEAIACFDEILRLDPRHAEALVKRGAALERLNRFEDALDSYEQAIEADGRMTLAYLSKGGMCNRLGRYDEAIQSYERALQVEQSGVTR